MADADNADAGATLITMATTIAPTNAAALIDNITIPNVATCSATQLNTP